MKKMDEVNGLAERLEAKVREVMSDVKALKSVETIVEATERFVQLKNKRIQNKALTEGSEEEKELDRQHTLRVAFLSLQAVSKKPKKKIVELFNKMNESNKTKEMERKSLFRIPFCCFC